MTVRIAAGQAIALLFEMAEERGMEDMQVRASHTHSLIATPTLTGEEASSVPPTYS